MSTELTADAPAEPQTLGASHPHRAGQLVLGIALLVAMFGGAAWVLWQQFGGPRQDDLVEVQPTIGQRILGNGPHRPPEMVRPYKNGNGLGATGGDVHLEASKPPKTGQWNITLTSSRTDLLNPELNARVRLAADPAYAKYLKVSDEQIKQLSAIPSGLIIPVSDDEKSKVAQLCQAYLDAKDKGPAQAALVKQLEAFGPAKLAAVRQSAADRAAAIQKILTPEQINAFKAK